MIYSVNGKLIHKDISMAVVECGGVGYGCRTTYSTLQQIGSVGENVKLLTYLNVREDAMELFGFASAQELNCFKMLISVSGVGPKAALTILSDTNPEKFAMTVACGDVKALTKSKGIGPKMAQRIILELKDKIAKEQKLITSGAKIETSPVLTGSAISEAISALVVLGYAQSDATRAVASLPENSSTEDYIKGALKLLAKGI